MDCDANGSVGDTHLLGTYYSLIQQRHLALRRQSELAAITLYCAPIVFDRNPHLVPPLVRTADLGWSCSGLSCYKRPEDYHGIVFPTSVYTLPLSLASSVGGWDTGPGAIGEDLHMMLKCYFSTNGRLNIESIPSPASMSNVTGGSTGWPGWLHNHKARYLQGLRHSKQLLDTILTLFKTRISQPWPMAQRPHPGSGFETGYGHIVAQYSLYLWKTLSLVL